MLKWLWVALLALLVALPGCGKKKSTPPEDLEPATVLFITDPEGARVIFDGEEVGTTSAETPLRLENVEVGEHSYRIELEGYQTVVVKKWTIIDQKAGQVIRIDKELVLITGLRVTTDPPGAWVYINGELQMEAGEVLLTPVDIENLPEREYTVTVKMEKYFGETEVVNLVGKGMEVYLELVPYPEISQVLFYAYNPSSGEGSTPEWSEPAETFSQKIFKMRGGEYSWIRIQATLAEPIYKDFTIGFDIYGDGGDRYVTEVTASPDSPTQLSAIFQDPTEDYFVHADRYVVRIVMDRDVLAEASFRVTGSQ